MHRDRWFSAKFQIVPWALAVLVGGGGTLLADDKLDAEHVAFFEKKIRPVLIKHCYECHSGDAKDVHAGVLLDTREGLLAGGDSGPIVVPGKPDEGTLMPALRHEFFEMPPDGKLPASVIADFERWIALGAPDPRDGQSAKRAYVGIDLEQGREFWSYRPITAPDVPRVNQQDWPRDPVDGFLLARLEAEGIAPSERAQPRTLLRRLSYDLTGLPPTPEELAAFETAADQDFEQAWESAVDRLLDSPRFGERWGRHWLDVVRFAESSGGGRTRIFPDAWRFRDYVIDSFNRDKPFDQLIREHIAGDLLPARDDQERAEMLTATGFLMLGPINYELQDKELLRMEVIDEQIDAVGQAFLAQTIGCARCHDHKFDPIPTADYYALAGIFRSTKSLLPGNVSGFVSHELPMPPDQKKAREAWEQQVKQAEAELKLAKDAVAKLTGTAPDPKSKSLESLKGIVVDDVDAQRVGEWQESSSNAGFVHRGYHHDQNTDKGNRHVTYTPKLPHTGRYEVRLAYTGATNRANNVPVTIRHAEGETEQTVDQTKPPPIDGTFVSLGEFTFKAGTAGSVTISNRGTQGHVIADAIQWLPRDGDLAIEPKEQPDQAALAAATKQVEAAEKTLAEIKKKAPPGPNKVMGVTDEDKPSDYVICIRGNPRNHGPEVPRGFLQVAMTTAEPPSIPESESGRRELAEWIASGDNPLSARVIVNRVWQHLYGAGLVRTPDNFGATGQTPSHSELLDHLAHSFVEDGWSIKRLIRRLVLSESYRLSSAPRPELATIDPDNRLLARQNRRRLDAEAIRDSMLVLSGRLDLRMGGSGIKSGTGKEFGYDFSSTRRSVYLPAFRNATDEILRAFDAADPNIVMGRRTTSTLATQALVLMNSPVVMLEARHAAIRLLSANELDDTQRIGVLYEQALGRAPTAREESLVLNYLVGLEKADPDTRREAWTNICQAVIACIDFRYLH